jgi:hypothetical protein
MPYHGGQVTDGGNPIAMGVGLAVAAGAAMASAAITAANVASGFRRDMIRPAPSRRTAGAVARRSLAERCLQRAPSVVADDPCGPRVRGTLVRGPVSAVPRDRLCRPDLDYREDEGLAAAEERFGVPVTHAQISR